ncbi:MAG: type II secretion system protein [Thermocrinis sp.]|jgi:prepilin-type N-terminal cleavage/methylation domain-containing protein|uniref:type II secretion system protein n=1 Tax=Thermocrinis sp. TaxID=2024383 RepID=UPI003BFE109B
MFGTCRGFTLIEVLIALSVLVITFSVLFELLLSARKDYELTKSLYQDMSILNNKILENRLEGVQVRERELKDYLGIKEVELSYGSAVIYLFKK